MNKIRIGGIIAVIAVLMLVVSLGMPWYTITSEDEEGETRTQRLSLDLLPERSDSEEDMDNTTTTFTITSWIATLGTSVSMISLLFIGMAVGTDSKKHAKIGSILLVIGFIFAIVAPLYMMISFPNAILGDQYDGEEDNLPEDEDTPAESFFGSETQDTWRGEVERSWGGGIGWFMSLIGGILLVLSLILVSMGCKSKVERRPVRENRQMQQELHQQQWGQEPQDFEQRPSQQQPQQQPDRGYEEQQVQKESTPPQEQRFAQQPAQQQQAQQSNTCPDCGQPIRYIEEYDSWYCDSCQEYK